MNYELIQNATIVNEGESRVGSLLIKDGFIEEVAYGREISCPDTTVTDAEGKYLLPGVIDDHVHFRDPGLTHKANMHTESMAAVEGGVTSVMDMPNVSPATTTNALWRERMEMARGKMLTNYAFYLGATNNNIEEIKSIDTRLVPGIKLFMGSSTGNMLVDREEALLKIFGESPKIIMTHNEDTTRINSRMKEYQALYGEDPDVRYHPEIRDAEACYQSTALAVKMATDTGARLHIAHISTARELELLTPSTQEGERRITAEACVGHLLYCDEDYSRLGTLIKCNPAIKTKEDREVLRRALTDGRISVIGTDHAPHLLREKEGGAKKAVSGMPMVQFSLVSMLGLVDEGVLSMERMVELMCHNPASLFRIEKRGFIREGYHADLTLVGKSAPYNICKEDILSLCGWSPRLSDEVSWRVLSTWVNGHKAWNGKSVDTDLHSQALIFQ